jgi:FKBP-type peptidyl-prolyl cis-trans isomerase FklB
MKLKYTSLFVIGLTAVQAMGQPAPSPAAISNALAAAAVEPVTPPDPHKVSYAIGMTWGDMLKNGYPDVNVDDVATGIKETMAGKPRYSEAEFKEIMNDFQKADRARQVERARLAAQKNKAAGEAFLATNAKEPGVVTLPSGLQYLVITNGTGATPATTNDIVTVNYRGTFIDGKEFDNSWAPSRTPVTRPAYTFIKGWVEALQLMKVGSRWKVFVPSDLAYGIAGYSPRIEPNASLIFEIELLSCAPAPTAANAAEPTSSPILYVPSQADAEKGALPHETNVPSAT